MTLMHNDTFKLGPPIGHYVPDWLPVKLNWRRAVCFGLISTIVSINPSDGAMQTQVPLCDDGHLQTRSRLMDHRIVH